MLDPPVIAPALDPSPRSSVRHLQVPDRAGGDCTGRKPILDVTEKEGRLLTDPPAFEVRLD